MITLNERQKELLKLLYREEDYITIKNISIKLKCSERTIRNDLSLIEEFIKKENGLLEKKQRLGIKLVLSDKVHLEDIMRDSMVNLYSSESRELMILSILILKGRLTIEKISNEMNVSKNTVVGDLKEIENKIKSHNVKIKKKVYHGMCVEGEEEGVRSGFLNIYLRLEENLKKEVKNRLIEESGLDSLSIQYKIIELENFFKIRYSQESIEVFEILILLSKCREKNGFKVNKLLNEEREEFKFLKESFPLENEEVGYLIGILDGLAKMKGEEKNLVTNEILNEISKVLNIHSIEESELKQQIGMHLDAAIHRIKNNFVIENPMLEEIKLKMAFIYKITEEILKAKEDILGVKFPEAEIAYMAMYFDAIFERSVKNKFDYNILVVCNGGLATSSLLKTRLNIMVPEGNIVSICRLRDVEEKLKYEKIDFIVTTVPLKLNSHKVIKVNPLLHYKDVEKIKAEIYNKRYEKNCKYLFDKVRKEKKENITTLIYERFSKFESEIRDWRESILECAKPLIKENKINKEYVTDIIKVIEDLGNYMVFIPEIAFVHATPENVIENSIGVLNLKEKISFGAKNKVLVKTIVLIANKEENMNLVNLINILTKEDNVEKFKNAKSYKDLETID
ncbi:MAG: BglG family transcription antiterminator [Clostridium sp.]|uniref:BglG family transcription antiterminator n=1 Tax=Clostridium sp. TaxID=1506 RepID=UPI003F3793E3